MKIFHICNGFNTNRLYTDLVLNIAKLATLQTVFVPGRKKLTYPKKTNDKLPNVTYHSPYTIRSFFDRLFFRRKIRKIIKYIKQNNSALNSDLVHAHTLFSDGAVALALKKEYDLPYIVAIRNTDINLFLRYAIFLRKTGLEILQNASKVIFISNPYVEQLKDYYPAWLNDENDQIQVVYNGINEFWLSNRRVKTALAKQSFRLLFIGDFRSNKNLLAVINAVKHLHKKGHQIKLEAIGYGGKNDQMLYFKKIQASIKYLDYISITPRLSRLELLEKFRQADIFILPSFFETFGLVYAEALSQGLPIIYTANQGFDKVFPEGKVGYSVAPDSEQSIITAIEKSMFNYPEICLNIAKIDLRKYFDWNGIACKYLSIYNQVLTDSQFNLNASEKFANFDLAPHTKQVVR